MLIEINNQTPEYPKIKQAVDILKNCGVIVYPTDTIYGFGCNIFCKEAVERIYKIKKKKATGFSFICPDLTDISKYAIVSDYAYRIMKRLLPGPYTFIFKATKMVPKDLIPNKKTVAIRIPDNAVCLDIIKNLGHPIVTTSVNLVHAPHFSDPLDIEKHFGDQVDLIIDAGILENAPSSVIDLTGDEPIVIRKGKGDVSLFE
ncbi:threonylcarbamoyl-AMP synthase [Candidatus Falkowbacteria bacterium]|jgi:tRNA threonylcarbamoyl adenosine modification protein (Sua5/YciO/YrdC/YwlC family)|nr:threonylcarbamoyl-AMP synthase [Candidatus Falkowbacteria bacterium]MBT5503104.1 threonylcarbamoyl-AMP synthase [Candidatus Falkowbacteria bacterium]MBT6574198.1 threonylcarbamoyl-AMP synthase [Candidatus Falkowbacteria bacterium]MBT7348655.1 threonylcarbamoyl-AMP synthase [Candidatus Falkowbacteria bacterium]MBT7500445.1 threonylcarbamoyl-AMP synthase [Candidatus Falkowbacteria bacterium]